ncbi:hypothetical protein D3C75_710130 [compost metagenome]
MIDQTVDILHKGADDAHTRDIMNVLFHIIQCEFMPFALHLVENALGLLDP